ncbi:hypothetical protein JSE7799_01573 [Jannaschia seosinensis]|uniref:PhnA-like protein n=1 Tax=Jannaschia seosinensis TaxID=313367 RepID=A0A0M7BBY4_9RHOB|nr:hypothetical protein [Jannaschia seosinensis]CUH38855.1 hypothetical protein JSE7799_01573 [Jannaschia seosinensis]
MADTTRNDTAAHARDLMHDDIERLYDGNGRAIWGAIFAGTVVALGIFVLLGLAGIGLGFTLIEADEASPMNGSLTTTAIWQFISQLIALGAGGYVAGRLAGVIHSVGAMLHGATVWALTTLVAVWLAAQAAMGIAGAAGSAVSTIASGVSSAAQTVIPDDFSLPDLSVGSLSMDDLPQGVQSALREEGITPENFRAEAREAFRAVISEQEQARIRSQAADAAQDIIRSPGNIGETANDFIDSIFGAGGVLSEEDRREAVAVMERRFGLTPQQAEEYLTQIETRVEELQAEATQAVETAQQEAVDAIDAAMDAAASAAWLAALASLIGLGAAVGGAAAGRVART